MNKNRVDINELVKYLKSIKKTEDKFEELLTDLLPNKQKCVLKMPGTNANVPFVFHCNPHGCYLLTDGKHYVRVRDGFDKPIRTYDQTRDFPPKEMMKYVLISNRALFNDRLELLDYIGRGVIAISK